METFFSCPGIAAAERAGMEEGTGAMALIVLFVVLPWLVILIDALFLGFNFLLALAMLLVFGMGLIFMAAAAEPA